jgi:2-polyprenyl-6-methoxyphenol hydroxylase-like FAD-dependent oxidoreductase
MLWRATSIAKPFLTGASMAMVGHADQKFVTYPIEPIQALSGLQCINWIAELRVDDLAPDRQDWNKQVSKDVFADAFAAWRFDWLDIPGLIDQADAYYEFPMVDRDPLPSWGRGGSTLLGDAAHPMYPIGSNGASQAILDAKSLFDCLVTQPQDPLQALRDYEQDRLPKTASIVLANRGQGPDHCLELVRQRAPGGFEQLDDVVSHQELLDIAARYKALVGLEKERIRARVLDNADLSSIVASIERDQNATA